MTRMEQIQDQFKGVYGTVDLYIEATQFYFIDVDADRLDGNRFVTLSCECCSDCESYVTELSYELEYMDEDDYELLIEQLTNLKNEKK